MNLSLVFENVWFFVYSFVYYFIVGAMKKANVRLVNGKLILNIRQFYLNNSVGMEMPGKGGIVLTADQWDVLAENVLSELFNV